jgi:hypothetical protein
MSAANQSLPTPVVLSLRRSFGYGDRLGLATPGHLAASRKFNFAPIFAQQSIREMARTQRTPDEVMRAAQTALAAEGYLDNWGADADHLKTEEDVQRTAAAGFTFFTIDPSAYVVNEADTMDQSHLETEVATMEADGTFPDRDWQRHYQDVAFHLHGGLQVKMTREQLYRAAVKYGRAVAYCAVMGKHIARYNSDRPYEVEVSVDETDSPTSTAEHLFFGEELKRRQVRHVVSVAPRFIGEFEKGIDYKGDLARFEASLQEHLAVAQYCGPYKISVHSGSDKFAAYPVIGRVCGELLHVKTAGTSYLEALRAVCRKAPKLFREIIEFSRARFETDKKTYHISTTQSEVESLPKQEESGMEQVFLDERPGRQLLHVTFGSVLTQGKRENGQTFKQAILELLESNPDLHQDLLDIHFTKHLALLNAG